VSISSATSSSSIPGTVIIPSIPDGALETSRRGDWLEPRKYIAICEALKFKNFNSRKAVEYLQNKYRNPPVYRHLTHTTVETFFTREKVGGELSLFGINYCLDEC
jgi:hypothetical protein